MRTRFRKAIRITGWSLGSVFALLISFVGLLAFPGFLFAHQLDYRNITVHSDVELRGRIEPILAQVGAQLSASEINDPSLRYDLYFAHGNVAFRILDHARWAIVKPLTGMWPSPNYATGWPPRINQVVCLDAADPENDVFRRDDWRSQLNLTHVLTHESGHLLLDYGMLGRSFLRDENGDDWHTAYYLARVLVEYSLDFRGMSFEELVASDVPDTEVMRALLADYAAGRF